MRVYGSCNYHFTVLHIFTIEDKNKEVPASCVCWKQRAQKEMFEDLWLSGSLKAKPYFSTDSKTVPLPLQGSAHVSRHFSQCPKKQVIPALLVDAWWHDERWPLTLPVMCPKGVICGMLLGLVLTALNNQGMQLSLKIWFLYLEAAFPIGIIFPSRKQWLLEQIK